jgi:hypothetical protein
MDDCFPNPVLLPEVDFPGHECEERVIPADADVGSRQDPGSPLADNDGTRGDLFTPEMLDAEPLGLGVASVSA